MKQFSKLLELSEAIVGVNTKSDLSKVVGNVLRDIVPGSSIYVGKFSGIEQKTICFWIDTPSGDLQNALLTQAEDDGSFDEFFKAHDLSSGPIIKNLGPYTKMPGCPKRFIVMYQQGFKEALVVELRNGLDRVGFLVIFSPNADQFGSGQVTIIKGVSSQLAVIMNNLLIREELLQRERESLSLLDFSNAMALIKDKAGLGDVINKALLELFQVEEYILTVRDQETGSNEFYLYNLNSPMREAEQFVRLAKSPNIFTDEIVEAILKSKDPVDLDINEEVRLGHYPSAVFQSMGINKMFGLRLKAGNDNIGILWTITKKPAGKFINGVAAYIAIAIKNISAISKMNFQLKEISDFKQQLEIENLYLQEEIETTHNYSEIIGSSAGMNKIFQMVSQVAATSSSVLILGETGTGKELIARAIHNNSLRKDKVMVKINCATLPPNLIESELFGHERGSFTGATDRRIGKFELANNSTLFLDEIGELPVDLQVKLLRALQEKEIERVGGTTTIKTDVRIIAATNRDLQKEVQLGNFRRDLYFRLNVFPISIPPLRERKEDIYLLATHFLNKHAVKTAKKISGFSSKVIKQLSAYEWPGNVRELEHLIERSILLATQPVITQVLLPKEKDEFALSTSEGPIKTIDEVEREHILYVLKRCNGKVSGVGGAAEALNIPSTTLGSKIQRLGIKKEFASD
jgi:formate hydrogenlyase transcriptional activator